LLKRRKPTLLDIGEGGEHQPDQLSVTKRGPRHRQREGGAMALGEKNRFSRQCLKVAIVDHGKETPGRVLVDRKNEGEGGPKKRRGRRPRKRVLIPSSVRKIQRTRQVKEEMAMRSAPFRGGGFSSSLLLSIPFCATKRWRMGSEKGRRIPCG